MYEGLKRENDGSDSVHASLTHRLCRRFILDSPFRGSGVALSSGPAEIETESALARGCFGRHLEKGHLKAAGGVLWVCILRTLIPDSVRDSPCSAENPSCPSVCGGDILVLSDSGSKESVYREHEKCMTD